jgi:hypothetical protein
MGHDWRDYNGCLEPKTTKRDWTIGIRTQSLGSTECTAYGTLAVLEAMLRIYYYNDSDIEFNLFDAIIGSRGVNLNTAMGNDHTIDGNVLSLLRDEGIMIPDISIPYKIAKIERILDELNGPAEIIIEKANKHLKTNGPIIATYYDSVIGSLHCVAIVGYTDDGMWICKDSWPLNGVVPYPNNDNTWNADGTCKIEGATGGYRNIDANDMLVNKSGRLYTMWLQKLNISIRENNTQVPLTGWSLCYLFIKKQNGNGKNLADSDPTFISRFVDRFIADKYGVTWGNCVRIYPKSSSDNLDNLEVMVSPDKYQILVHACKPGINEEGYMSDVRVDNGDANVSVQVNINGASQCAKEILYPFALHAINRQQPDDVKVALNALFKLAEISPDDFIEDLKQRLVDLKHAHNIGIDGADGTLNATEDILELVNSMKDL